MRPQSSPVLRPMSIHSLEGCRTVFLICRCRFPMQPSGFAVGSISKEPFFLEMETSNEKSIEQ